MPLKYGLSAALLFICLTLGIDNATGQVTTGLDNLIAEQWAPLKGKHVGLITNQTGVTRSGQPGAQAFAGSKALKLVALYGPEHGIFGDRKAGVTSDASERYEGVPVYSLYGSTRKPTKAILKEVNALVFDIQDVGVRPYTFLSTMILAMEAAAEQSIPFYVLDRPDPLSGDRIEGNILDNSLKSFVGQVPVPYIHGMTLGELALMAKAKGWFNKAAKLKLTVIPMKGWKRSMYWTETGLTWTPPSPNVPRFENAVGLAMLGATGELGLLSVGVGSDKQFLRVGSTLLAKEELLGMVSASLPTALRLSSEDFKAETSAGVKTYHGVGFDLPRELAKLTPLYQGQFTMLESMLHDTAFRASFDALPFSVNTMFEKVTGMHGLLDTLKRCKDLEPLFTQWKRDAEKFREERKPYLLYH